MLTPVLEMRDTLMKAGLPVPRMVLGGTPTFPVFATMEIAGAECSPGTCVLNDVNYGQWFQDLGEFTHAALLLTRVISRPTANRVTFDLGYKAVASDPPAGKRCVLLDIKGEHVLQNEEHLVIESAALSWPPRTWRNTRLGWVKSASTNTLNSRSRLMAIEA